MIDISILQTAELPMVQSIHFSGRDVFYLNNKYAIITRDRYDLMRLSALHFEAALIVLKAWPGSKKSNKLETQLFPWQMLVHPHICEALKRCMQDLFM